MSEKRFNIAGIGELLWDVLPTGKQPGGAPANFAYISSQLGDCGIVASRVGNDSNGIEIIERLKSAGVKTESIQIDENRRTGTVNVELKNGQPSYTINEGVAWDFLELTANWRKLALNCDAVCFGSLAQRNPVSRNTIHEFLSLTNRSAERVFDVNLRQNYFSQDVLQDSLNAATIAKLNHEELPIVAEMFKISGKIETERIKNIRKKFDLKLVCITRGANGSLLVSENAISEHAGIRVEIADTIGAGDAFTAAMIHGVLRGWNLDEINRKANRVAAFVASQRGAMPEIRIAETNLKSE